MYPAIRGHYDLGDVMKNLVKLRAWRDSAGLTQQELADMTGLTRRRVSDFETGQRNLKRDSLEDYATALGVI